MPYDPTLFQSTAHYYSYYRPAYPSQLFADIAGRYGLSDSWPGRGTLFDLGSGTGEMTLPLAKYFERVFAWDPDADMLVQARRNARAALAPRQLRKISFVQKSSDDLANVTVSTFGRNSPGLRLVAMGQSFHWMDKPAVLRQLHPGIQPGGGIVIISGISDVEQNELTARKNEAVRATVQKYLGPRRRAGKNYYANTEDSYADLLTGAGFYDPREQLYEYVMPMSVDQVVGYLFSLSWASKYQFGDRADAFEAEIRKVLNGLLEDAGAEHFEERVKFSSFSALR